MSEFLKFVKSSIQHWYILLFVGILFVVMGIYSFSNPIEAYVGLALFFGVVLLVSGILEVVFSISNRKVIDNWGWTLVLGVLTFLVGLLLFNHPGITMVTLPLIIGFVLLFRSIAAISYSIDLKHYDVQDWGYLMCLGILGTVFSFFILWNPLAGGLAITVWIGLAFITSGAHSIYVSLKLRKLSKLPGKIADKLKG